MCVKVKMPVYNMKLAGCLMMRGFVLQGTDKDKQGSGRTVFFFNDSDDLQKVIKEYFNK